MADLRRRVIFISKATPEDDEFVLWLAPRLEASGYTVFSDILSLDAGVRWRKTVTSTLQSEAVKMLLCCRDASLNKDGVQEEIGIAEDLTKEINDPKFIIPLRLEKFKKLFGIGELQYVDFLGDWAEGLRDLLDTLQRQNIPRSIDNIKISPNWENYRRRLSIKVEHDSEVLTTNWLRVVEVPDILRYYQPSGAINQIRMERACRESPFPCELFMRGFFSFAEPDEIKRDFDSVGSFVVHSEHNALELAQNGSASPKIFAGEAKNLVFAMFRKAWEEYCRSRGLYEYAFSKQLGFHISDKNVPLGKFIPWGTEDRRRSSMLCNISGGKVWEFGVSATPNFWPFLHFRVKSRVLFAEVTGNRRTGQVFKDPNRQHRLRRSHCKGWRNKVWYGRMMAFLKFLSDLSPYIELPLSGRSFLKLDAKPVLVTSPVTTELPDTMSDDSEEQDMSTLGSFHIEED